MGKLKTIFTRGIALLGAVIFVGLLYFVWRYTAAMYVNADEKILILHDSPVRLVLVLASTALVGILLHFLAEKCSARTTHIIALIGTGVLFVWMFLLVRGAGCYPVADQEAVYQGALILKRGILDSEIWNNYFHIYPYQLGQSFLYSLFFSVSGNDSWQVLQYGNVFFACASFYTGYWIVKELFDKRGAELLYLLAAMLFLPMQVLTLFVYGDTFGLCAATVGIFLFLRANREGGTIRSTVLYYLGLMICLALMYIVRSPLIIVWIAMVIVQCLYILRWKDLWRVAVVAVMLIAMLGGQRFCIGLAEKKLGADFGDGMPISLWFIMSLQEGLEEGRVPGSDNGKAWNVFEGCGYNREIADAFAKEELDVRLTQFIRQPLEALDFFKRKQLCQWAEPSYGCFVMTNFKRDAKAWVEELYQGRLQTSFYDLLDGFQSAWSLGICVFFVFLAKRERRAGFYLFALILIGEFFFSMIWEAKSRYIYPFVFLMMPCVGGMWNKAAEKIGEV